MKPENKFLETFLAVVLLPPFALLKVILFAAIMMLILVRYN